ncbi:uncharacterized protein LOC127362525 [Dicentrarchus labrax]|uniref:uncharacterized protein LOC127362525 n=1 Tax=Dicentrarchus labrax TaxID=13489 RepID=UPI0021F5B48F|nr:uncharacterized protein LOC127362525 [Dicentrarchus labrax]
MRRLYCFALGFFLLAVRAEKEDFQGFYEEQTRSTTVTKDLLLKKENTTGHGTEALSTENTLKHTTAAVAARVVFFDTRPTAPYETTPITKALAIIASQSRKHFVSKNGQSSLTSTSDNPSALRIHTETEIPVISNYEKMVFSSTQAAFESVMNGTSEPEVHSSTDAVKASLWLHTQLDNRNQRNTDSITLTSADGGPGVPILSASHPRVIDNLAAPPNDNDDKRSQGKDEKGISNLGRNEYLFSATQSIFQRDRAGDSVRGNTVTNLCLTCLKDRRPVSTEKSVALPVLSPDGSSDSLSTEEIAIDFSQFATSLPSLYEQSIGEQEEILNQEISHQNISEHSGFGMREQQVYNLTFSPSFFNKSVNHSQSILNNSQIKSFLLHTGTVAFDTWPLAEMSSATQKDAKKQARHTSPSETLVTERLISNTTALYHSLKSLRTVRKPVKNGEQEIFEKRVNIGDPQSKLIYLSKNTKNASHSLSTNFKNVFIHTQPSDVSSGSVSSTSVIAEAPNSSQKSVLPEGSDHSNASHPTVRTRLIEAHSAITSFNLSRPTVKHPDSHSLTEKAHSLISVLRIQTPAKPSSQTKEPILTLLLTDSAIKFASVTTKRHLTDTQDSHIFNTVNSIVKQTFVDPSGPENKKPKTPTSTTEEVVVPLKLFLSESRQDFDDDASKFTLTTPSSQSFSKRLTIGRLFGGQSKITQERGFDVSNQSVESTHQSFVKYNRDLIRESLIVHNLKPGDKNEQVLTVVAEDEDKEIMKIEGKQGEEIKESKEILKLQEEEDDREDEKFGNKKEELFRSDKIESRKQENIIHCGEKINQNKEEDKMEEHEAKTSRREGGGLTGEEDVTLRQNKDLREGEGWDEEGVGEKQRMSLTKEGAEARREQTASREDLKHNREIGTEDMTNVPLGPTTNSKELNRDKGHTVTNLSSCHSLIKQLGATERKGVYLGENIAQIAEMKNKPFSYKVTTNHRPLHSTLISQNPKLPRMTYFPKETHTQIQPHQSTHGAMRTKHGGTSSLTKESTQNKVVETTFSVTATQKIDPKLYQTFGVSTSKFSDAFKPTISPRSTATKSAHPVLNSISNMLSLTTPQLAITAGFLRAQSHFTVNSSTLSASIIYSTSDHRHKFSTSVLKANSFSLTTNEREKAEHIIPAHIFEYNVKDPLTSNKIEEVNISTSVNPALPLQMYNDSSTRPPTTAALSFEANISIGQLQPHQGKSAPQISQSSSSSFDMTSGQPCSFKLSEQTAHSDALHVPVDDNEQRSVQTLMASMSPKAKSDQFPLSSMSPQLNLVPFGGDSLPGIYSLTGLTRSASEKEILGANSGTEYANSGRGHAESSLGTADETNQTEENDSLQNIVTLAVKDSDAVTKQMAENRDEESSSSPIAQATGKSKHHGSNTDEFNSLSIIQTENQAVKNTNENNHNDLFNVDGSDEANNTVKTTLENNLSQVEGYNETGAKPVMFAIQATHKIEQAINKDFVPVTNDFAIPALDTNDRTGTTVFVESDRLPEIPQLQANDVTKNAISDMEHHTAKTTKKQHDLSAPQGTVGDNTLPEQHINFRSDLKAPNISTPQIADRIMNVTSDFQITTTTASTGSFIVSTKAHESALTTSENVQVVIEKSSQAAYAEHMVQSNSHIEPLSLREPPTTPTTGKLPPAVKRKNATETSVEEPKHEISVQPIEQSQHTPPGMIAITSPINDPEQGVQTGLLNTANLAGGSRDTTPTIIVEYSSFKDIKTTPTTIAFEAKNPLQERTPTVHTLDRADKHKNHALSEKTSGQEILGAVTDSVPPTGISPPEIINKTSCRTIGCAKSGETTETTIEAGEIDHTASEKMYKTQAGNMGKELFNTALTAGTKPENGNCSTDCPLPGKATPQATNLDYAVLSLPISKSYHDYATVDETPTTNAKSMTYETSTKTWRVLVETDHLERRGTLEQDQFVEKTTHSLRETYEAQEAIAAEVTFSEPEATTAQTPERTLLTEKNKKTQLNREAAKAEIFEVQNATRSTHAMSKGETAVQESGRRLLLPEPESESELPTLKHRRRTSPHLYLSGVTEVSDDLCGSGNYTAEMSLNLGRGIEPGDAVPAMGNLRVVINLKTNNSQINLEVTSCCLSPTIQPDLTNSTCCLFSRLAAEPAGITLLPSALSTSASFTISLFQMINYSVVYLHCDLSVCLRNRSDCERQCLQQRSAFPLEGPEAIVTNLRNRISFGPMLKEVKNSTFPEEIDPSELDLVLVMVSLVVGSSLVTVTLLLVWLAYRRRAIWLLHSAAPPRACCGCLRPGGDLILP